MRAWLERLGVFLAAPDGRPAGTIEQEIDEELRFHIEERAAELAAAGLPPAEARAAALAAFGDYDRIRAACRRVHRGEHDMLQRIQLAATLALLAGVAFLGYRLAAARADLDRERARSHDQLARVMTEVEELVDVLKREPAEAQSEPLPQVLGAPVELPADPASWRARFLENPQSWRHGLGTANLLAELPAEDSLRILRAIYADLPVPHREQLFKPFVFHGGRSNAVEVLQLGATDPEPSVRGRAWTYLKAYAFRDFSEEPAEYEAWRARHAGKDLAAVLQDSARELVERLAPLSGRALERELRLLDRLRLGQGPAAGIDLRAAMRDAGLLALARRWLAAEDDAVAVRALQWLGELDLDEATQRELLLPRVEDDAVGYEVAGAAVEALGRRGNAWAVEPLLADLERTLQARPIGPKFASWGHARALAAIGDPRAIPALIAWIDADGTYETVYGLGWFGLHELTGVQYDESHDGAWWRAWWERNRERFPEPARSLEVPSVSLGR